MAAHDRRHSPSSRIMAKVVKKIREDPPEGTETEALDEKSWLKLTTFWNFGCCDPRFGFQSGLGRKKDRFISEMRDGGAESSEKGIASRREEELNKFGEFLYA
jgi:hypothetical protein